MTTKTITGGDRLEAALRKISAKLKNGGTVKVGFLEGDAYQNGMPLAAVAAIQNFGAPRAGIPPRPFFSNTIKEKSASWPKAIERNLKQTNYDVPTTLERMGQGIQSQIQQSILDTYEPPLSPVTVMLRGMRSHDQSLIVTGKTVGEAAQRVRDGKTNYGASSKPLIDTHFMIRHVNYAVKTT